MSKNILFFDNIVAINLIFTTKRDKTTETKTRSPNGRKSGKDFCFILLICIWDIFWILSHHFQVHRQNLRSISPFWALSKIVLFFFNLENKSKTEKLQETSCTKINLKDLLTDKERCSKKLFDSKNADIWRCVKCKKKKYNYIHWPERMPMRSAKQHSRKIVQLKKFERSFSSNLIHLICSKRCKSSMHLVALILWLALHFPTRYTRCCEKEQKLARS